MKSGHHRHVHVIIAQGDLPGSGTTGHMMRELGYYTAYKGKWHLTEKLEKPLPDEKDEDIDVGD
ncbi:hypothetical protein ONR49_25690, partial [Salmonella enterica subsp. enterica serovar Virginia]|nr:hypothetical protein [Salmonella enterica subsp. enterica serovar Virginia]